MLSFELIFLIIISIILIKIILGIIQGFKEWSNNNTSLKVSVEASIVDIDYKRSRLLHNGKINATPIYVVTFILPNNEKMKFELFVGYYKWIKIGDSGILTAQGTRFINFKKHIDKHENYQN